MNTVYLSRSHSTCVVISPLAEVTSEPFVGLRLGLGHLLPTSHAISPVMYACFIMTCTCNNNFLALYHQVSLRLYRMFAYIMRMYCGILNLYIIIWDCFTKRDLTHVFSRF